MNSREISVSVNDETHRAAVEPRLLLADFLRDRLRLTGTHISCEIGACGVCTVLVDGRPVRSCLMLAVQADGAKVTTVEGLGTPERLHPIQQAFHEHHGLQCGFCTPGFLMALTALFSDKPDASDAEIREALDDVLCRCTGYQNIFAAACAARAALKKSRGE
jgi:carbon-monoxide dehydrogenase small subunit